MIEHTQINTQIKQVCLDKSITCLHAIESGSRAWGFASTDSDYDVRLIYCHDLDWYLQLFADKDSFEYIDNQVFSVPFDIGGWDIRKALTLMYKSNAVIFEWLHSPIIYQSDDKFLRLITEVQSQFFSPKTIFFHYRGMAKTAHTSLHVSEPINLKKWFYLIRALLCSVWALTRQTPPPVLMADMFELLTSDQQAIIEELITIKQQVDESHKQLLPLSAQALTDKLWQWGDQLISTQALLNKKQGDVRQLEEIFKIMVYEN